MEKRFLVVPWYLLLSHSKVYYGLITSFLSKHGCVECLYEFVKVTKLFFVLVLLQITLFLQYQVKLKKQSDSATTILISAVRESFQFMLICRSLFLYITYIWCGIVRCNRFLWYIFLFNQLFFVLHAYK